ncbi:hypothetical protein STA3757_17370 [Stanieria sp. NIES-3757]|nr:hypothetical protein STA3757_17370 [Stanieria sp. NIES-3757]
MIDYVGMYEHETQVQGIEVNTIKILMSNVALAIAANLDDLKYELQFSYYWLKFN